VKRIISYLLILSITFFVGCSYNSINSKNKSENNKLTITDIPKNNVEQQPKSDILNVNIPIEQDTNNKWESIDRLRYVQGKIVSLKKISDGKSILNLEIEKNYHDGTDPVDTTDYPFKIGDVVEFYLNGQPKIDLGKIKRIIVYESDFTTNGNDTFLGASIKYYERDGKFFDMEGKQISLPPTQ
jgi:hypothetical protein